MRGQDLSGESPDKLRNMRYIDMPGLQLRGDTSQTVAPPEAMDVSKHVRELMLSDAARTMNDQQLANTLLEPGNDIAKAIINLATSQHDKNTKEALLVKESNPKARMLLVQQAKAYNDSLQKVADFKVDRQQYFIDKALHNKQENTVKDAQFRYVDASQSNLKGIDFSGIDCSGTIFSNCELENTLWNGSNLDNADFRSKKDLSNELLQAFARANSYNNIKLNPNDDTYFRSLISQQTRRQP